MLFVCSHTFRLLFVHSVYKRSPADSPRFPFFPPPSHFAVVAHVHSHSLLPCFPPYQLCEGFAPFPIVMASSIPFFISISSCRLTAYSSDGETIDTVATRPQLVITLLPSTLRRSYYQPSVSSKSSRSSQHTRRGPQNDGNILL